MAILKTTLGLLTAMTLASAAASLVGCQDAGDRLGSPDSNEPAGAIGLALQAAPGFILNTVSYTITGPFGFTKTGTIDVSNSSKITALIGSLPAGKGFTITLTGNAVGGAGSCTGSASFDIVARQTTSVTVGVTCHEGPTKKGSVLINGVLNVCAVIDGVSASPAEVAVGGKIALGVVAHDSDAAPKALKYKWTASAGTLSDDAVANPTFTCTAAGQALLSVSVTDGDPTPSCADSGSLVVQCTESCAGFNRITATLGELAADCRGTVDPRDFVVDAAGRIAPNFQDCPADPTNERGALLHIKQLLSIQRADVPNVLQCTAGRFKQALEKFKTRGIDVCPTWSKKNVLNPPTPELIKTLSPLLPVLNEEEQTTLKGPFVPPPELDQLKIKSTYTVTLPPGTSQQCNSPADCATACAEAFPGFVLPTPPGTPVPDDSVLVDPDSWWSQEFYGVSGNGQPDPNNMNTAFYHEMGFVLPTPGDTYGALARWNPCNATVVNTDAMGQPFKASLTTSTSTALASLPPVNGVPAPITTECQSEKCNYYIGGYPDNPIYVKTKLQRWCADAKYADQSTCLAFCGKKLP